MEVGSEKLPKLAAQASHKAKLTELLRNLTSVEVELCSDASKEFIKLLRGDSGAELLREYVRTSSNCSELLQAWKLRQGKPGLSNALSLITAILGHPDGMCKGNDSEGIGVSRAIDKFARLILVEKLEDVYKELNSKEAKRQNAALFLMASVVRRGPSLASDVAKSFDFKLPVFPKLAEYKHKKLQVKRKHSTRRAFIDFAMSFLEVGKPGLLRWVLQQKEMYSGVLRGLGNDDDETIVYILSTLRDRILIPGSLIPPGLRSVLFGSVTLDQLISISGRDSDGDAAELAHSVLVTICTNPSNGLMPDLKRQPSPLRGNPKRLLGLMKKLKVTDIDYHRDLLVAIVKENPSFGSLYMDVFPYNLEDYTSPTWFAAISLAANLISEVGSGFPLGFLDSHPDDPPFVDHPDWQSVIKCLCPRPFSRLVANKGLLHSNFLVKHGTLRLVLEVLKLLDTFISRVETYYCSRNQMLDSCVPLKEEIQNEVRILLPDPQVLLSLLSSLNIHYKSPESCLKRKEGSQIILDQSVNSVKKLKIDSRNHDEDILVSGVYPLADIALPSDNGGVQNIYDAKEMNNKDDHRKIIADIWALDESSMCNMKLQDEETLFYSKLLDTLKIYHRVMPAALEGSFDFFKVLPGNPLVLPTILQHSLLSLLIEVIGWSSKREFPFRTPGLMFKHLQQFINLLLCTPFKDIKGQAHILAEAAMFSTGAFDKNPKEIGVWFLFLPGYSADKSSVGEEGIEVLKTLFSVTVTFLCDAVSTTGNNLLKYWDLLRYHTYHLKGIEDVSPNFSPLVICVLEKCLRVLTSESGTFTLSEKSMISLYVCNSVKSLLQTQVEAGLLSSLVDLLISRRIQECCSVVDNSQDLCEWGPLKNLLLFARSIINHQSPMFSSIERKAHADSSFIDILGAAKRVLRSENDCGLARVAKAFMHSVISTHPAVILQNFPLVISISSDLFGVPLSLLLSILFLEPSLLHDVFKFWPEIFSDGLEKSVAMINGGERKEEILTDTGSDLIGSASVAFGFFLKQASFHVLFPAIVSADEPFLLEGSKLQDLLWAKLSELEIGNFISSVHLVLFWFHQIQLSYRMKPLAKFEQLSGECCSLIEWMLVRLLGEQPDSGQVIIRNIVEVIEVILCHPVVILSLEDPLDQEEVTEGISGDNLENFLGFARQGINKMDRHVLNVLTVISEHLVTSYSWRSLDEVECVNEKLSKAFRGLARKLNLIFRYQVDECLKSENLKPLNRAFYILHTFIQFISPLELLELVQWMLSRISLSDSALRVTQCYFLSVGLWIAGCAFDMLSAYFLQPCAEGIPCSVFWGIEERSFDVLLFENIYFEVVKIALHFELDCADICLLKAVNLANKLKVVQRQCLALSMDILRVILNTPMKVFAHCMNKTSMTRANILYCVTEVSPFHLSIFGHLFSDMIKEYLLHNGNVIEGTPDNAVSEDNFVMLLPTALTYLNSTDMKCRVQFHKCAIDMSSFYCRILLQSFSDWKNYVSRDIFNVESTELLATSSEEILSLVSGSLLGKAILMLRYYFALNGNAVNLKKRLRLFDSVCPHTHDNILDCDVNEVDAYSPIKALNLVNRVVAKTYFCSMLLFPKDDLVQSMPKDDGNMKEILSGKRSKKVDLSRIHFMNILVNTWKLFVKKFPLNSSGSGKVGSSCVLFRFLEAFILRNILELTREMHKCPVKLNWLPLIEQLGRSCLLHRFEDPETLKMLRGVLGSLSDRNCYILVLQLVLAHSQFVPTICYASKSSGVSQIGVIFRPMASILSLLVIPSTDQSAINGQSSQQKTSELYLKKLELVKLLRKLFHHKAWQCGFDFEKDIGISSRELLFLLLSSYGATLSEVDLEIYNLMLEIESVNEGDTGSLSEMDYLWGIAAVKVRKERELEQNVSSDKINDVEAVEERRRNQFRENLLVDPKICATTVLHFPYDITLSGRTSSLFEIQHGSSGDMVETCYSSVDEKHIYDPVFILHFSIHSLLMGYVEPVEFASLGLLAIAFVSISSADDEIRRLGYDALGRFKAALEKCQKRKDVIRLRLLLTYLQNGIEQPWQRIPSFITTFAAEASFILLDPSHNHFSTISRFLVRSPRVNIKCIPLFQDLFWSSSDTFRTDRMWVLRLLYAGINSDDDAQVYIRNDILEILLAFYVSPLSDNESKGLILQVVKKSVKLNRMALYLVEHCSLISWLSSITSVVFGRQYQAQRCSPLITVMEVVTDVISSQNTIEWLQMLALEQISELSTQLYRLLLNRNLIKDKAHLLTKILAILTSTLKISQKREVYQPHFTLSIEGLFQIYHTVNECNHGNFSPIADLGLRVILMSTPPAAIFHVDQEKLLKFVHWAISTALQSNSEEVTQSRNAYCRSRILLEEKYEDSLISKLLRWLTASVILGKLSWRTSALASKSDIERISLETLESLIEHDKNRCGENHSGFGCEAMLAAAIFHLQLLLGLDYRLLASVVTALSLLLSYDLSHLGEMECLPDDGNNLALLWSRIRCPVEANRAWRWSFHQPWNDLSSNSTDAEKLAEVHACQSLLLIISNVIAKKSSLHSNILSHHDLENCGVFNWERSILDVE